MIDDYSNSEMLKKIDQFLITNYIFCNPLWLKEKINGHKNSKKLEEDIYKEIIKSDINEFIDKERAKNYLNLSLISGVDKKLAKLEKYIFLEIIGYSNIADPIEKDDQNNKESFDVLEKIDSKFLQSEDEPKVKTQKIILKMELSDGVDKIFGFEYENIKNIKTIINNKHPKILVGPKAEVRRGILYLDNSNVKLL